MDIDEIRMIGTCHTCIVSVSDCLKPKMRSINPMSGCADWHDGVEHEIDPDDIWIVDDDGDPFANSPDMSTIKSEWTGK